MYTDTYIVQIFLSSKTTWCFHCFNLSQAECTFGPIVWQDKSIDSVTREATVCQQHDSGMSYKTAGYLLTSTDIGEKDIGATEGCHC